MAFSFLDFIFPVRCVSCGSLGRYICSRCHKKIQYLEKPICPVCQRQAIGGITHPGCASRYTLDGLIAGFRYRGPVKLAIVKIKYRWVFDISRELVDELAERIWMFDVPKDYVLVPIPLHTRRKNWRGFNQAELICKILAKKFQVRYKNILIRNIETKTQVGLAREERMENIRGAFTLNSSVKNIDTVILVDDVYTTGATMAEACNVLKKGGVKNVWGMVLALG